MDGSVLQTWMSDVLHVITQGLLVPDIVLLIAFIAYALFCIGSVLVEFFTERKHFKVTMPKLLAALMNASEEEIPAVIEESGLLKRQKIALLTVYDYRMLPGDALVALIKRLVGEEEARYNSIAGRNNMAARVSPMLGLMGTLIPLGPGIQALGSANTELLSASLLIAFDTTVAGLVVAAVCMVIGKIRTIWYDNYMSALDSAMATMLQKIEDMRAEGKIQTKEPSDYAFLFEQSVSAKMAEQKKGASDDKAESAKADSEKTDGAAPAAAATAAAPTLESAAADTGAPASAPSADFAADASGAAAGGAGVLGANGAETAQPLSDDPVQPGYFEAAPSVGTGFEPQPQFNATPAYDTGAMNFGEFDFQPTSASGAHVRTDSLYETAPFNGAAADPAPTQGATMSSLQASASFEPVPDPTFISDLAAAAKAADTGQIPVAEPLQAAEAAGSTGQIPVVEPLPTAAPSYLEPDAATRPHQTGGWYQPRLHTSDDASQPYSGNPYSSPESQWGNNANR